MSLRDTQNEAAIKESIWNGFRENTKSKHGNLLFIVLFKQFLEIVLRDSEIQTQGIIYQRKQQAVAFADDGALVIRSNKEHSKDFMD